MPSDPVPPEQLTLLLRQAADGDTERRHAAFAAVYGELRRLARAELAGERANHTLQATALVNEAFLKLAGVPIGGPPITERGQFFAAAAAAMRRILVDHARGRGRSKRGGGQRRLPLDALELATGADTDLVLAIDDAVRALEARDPRLAELAKLRLFSGLEDAEIATALGVSERTVRRDWLLARAVLQRDLLEEA